MKPKSQLCVSCMSWVLSLSKVVQKSQKRVEKVAHSWDLCFTASVFKQYDSIQKHKEDEKSLQIHIGALTVRYCIVELQNLTKMKH